MVSSFSSLGSLFGFPKKSSKKKSIFAKGSEFRRCDDLKLRIKTYVKKEKITQKELAERMKISTRSMTCFMSAAGGSVNTECYITAMKYLKTRMPLAGCTVEGIKIIPSSTNWTLSVR